MTISYNQTYDLYNLLEKLKVLYSGFYTDNKFLILPRSILKNSEIALPSYSLLLPDELATIPNLAQTITSSSFDILDPRTYTAVDERIHRELIHHLRITPEPELIDVTTTEQRLVDIINTFNQRIPAFLPGFYVNPELLDIYMTNFGTRGSFYSIENKLVFYIRQDTDNFNFEQVAFFLIASHTRKILEQKYFTTWNESQFVEEILINETAIKTCFEALNLDISQLNLNVTLRKNNTHELRQLSEVFVTKLGVKKDKAKHIFLKDDHIYVGDTLLDTLTYREEQILKKLLLRAGTVLSYDELADLIINDEESFNLYTLAKCIERLREKLKKAGLTQDVIKNARGQGFYIQS